MRTTAAVLNSLQSLMVLVVLMAINMESHQTQALKLDGESYLQKTFSKYATNETLHLANFEKLLSNIWKPKSQVRWLIKCRPIATTQRYSACISHFVVLFCERPCSRFSQHKWFQKYSSCYY